jgi:[acyl-carrier-protein] S-malonyltransferase
MTKAAMLFPGQGSQYVGMGKDLVDSFPRAAELYQQADDTLGLPLSRISFEGDAETLTATKNAQPAILIHSVAVMRILAEEGGLGPAITAGHSLGEYSALVAAGVVDAMDALRIVRKRGELMYDAGTREPGTMAAIIGMEYPELDAVCREAAGGETVVVANINSPGQLVISGGVAAVERAMELAGERGARKVVRLNVSGAFHSPLMSPAGRELVAYIKGFPFRDASVGVVTNADAKVVTRADEIVDALGRQLTSPVRWADSMSVLCAQWSGPILEVGPGKVLAGLLKRIDASRPVQSIGTSAELADALAAGAGRATGAA